MPLVGASVCSIIAVQKVKYYRADLEAILLQLHYIKQMSSKLQKKKQKEKKHRLDRLKVFIYICLRGLCKTVG